MKSFIFAQNCSFSKIIQKNEVFTKILPLVTFSAPSILLTFSQEAAARHEAERLEQEARGRLERQKIEDEAEAEKSKEKLLQLQALSAAIESTGQAKAEAQSRAESSLIEGQAAVDQARLRAQAAKIEADADLERLTAARDAELAFIKEQVSDKGFFEM